MPNYEHDKDYPFAAFITNLGKYNEGELVGEWVKFPTTADELKKVFERIGIGQKDDFGQPYEEWFITDYDCYVDGLYDRLGEYANLDELNYLASKLDEMSSWEYDQFCAAMEVGDHTGSVQEIINLTENLDCYDVYPGIEDYDDLGRYFVEELDALQVPEHLKNYIDYEAYGRDIALEEGGEFTDHGYVRDTGDRFVEVYDGDRENIPEEYRVMSVAEEELTEDEISEWAMDIAFDMDEFFRQNDPQYAAEHPAAHEAKEDIYEKLSAGRIAALEGRLTDLGQTEADYLLSELGKYKAAADYDESLDIDTDDLREAVGQPEAAFSIYQLKDGDQTLDYRFEPLDSIHRNGLSVNPANYELVYHAPLTPGEGLEDIYTRFNIDRPADFTGHSLSVSDIVVLHEDGQDTAHYCDRVGFTQVPEFLSPVREKEAALPTPDERETGETVRTPRGSFYVTDMTREQMEAAGYGLHHASEDGKFLIMGNGTRAFAISAEQVKEKDNPLRTAEMTVEDDYGMIDGIINNGRRDEAPAKPSIRERLEDAKRECAEHKPPEKGRPGRSTPEHGDL